MEAVQTAAGDLVVTKHFAAGEVETAHWKGRVLDVATSLRRKYSDLQRADLREQIKLKLALAVEGKEYKRPDGMDEALFVMAIDEIVDIVLRAEPGSTDSASYPFSLDETGVYFAEKGKGETHWVRVCSYLEIEAATRDELSEDWGRSLLIRDPSGVKHRWVMRMSARAGDARAVKAELLRLGLTIEPGPKAENRFWQYIDAGGSRSKALIANAVGWHQGRFVLPDVVIGDEGDERVLFGGRASGHAYRVSGSLEDWREHVAAAALGNSRLVFVISLAFAAPLVEVVGAESGGFHMVGSSSTGKTTALDAAGSVWGGGGIQGYKQLWRTTANGLEGTAARHCDALLCLDEISQANGRDVGEAAYLLANGQGKARAKQDGSGRAVAQWRCLFLSTGELSLSDKLAEDGKVARAGQQVRVLDIPADAGRGLGLFEDTHGVDAAEFAEQLKAAATRYFGTPIRGFLRQLCPRREAVAKSLLPGIDEFVRKHLPAGTDGQATRAAQQFGLVAAAGELATSMGITGWKAGTAEAAAGTCFAAWLERRGGPGPAEVRDGLEQVRRFFQQHGESRFTDLDAPDDKHATINRAGYRKTADGGDREFFVFVELFRSEVCRGYDHKQLVKVAVDKGWLTPGQGARAPQTQMRPPGAAMPLRFYRFSSRILGDAE